MISRGKLLIGSMIMQLQDEDDYETHLTYCIRTNVSKYLFCIMTSVLN